MNTAVRHILLSVILTIALSIRAEAFFSGFNAPDVPGERTLSVTIELRGLPISRYTVDCIYSADSMEVVRALAMQTRTGREPSALAKLEAAGNDRMRASIILPHRDHDRPNSRDRNPRIINSPDKVYYAWIRSNSVSGATSQLEIPSAVKSFPMPRLFIIAYAGDSYASGEGAPASGDEKWIDDACHRSELSGGVRAIKKLIQSHPEYGIRYVNVTCSGAIIGEMTSNQRTNSGAIRNGQLVQVESWLRRNNRDTVDILLMSIGGNDVGFAPAGTAFMVRGFVTSMLAGLIPIPTDDVKGDVSTALDGLGEAYDGLADIINGLDYRVGRVVIMGYPDPTRNREGLCGPDNPAKINVLDCWGPIESGINHTTFEFIATGFVARMNTIQSAAAQRNGWDRVAISAGTNGLCNCDEPFFNTLGQSLGNQGDVYGTMHPNSRGFREMYRDPVYRQLRSSMSTWHDDLRAERRDRAIAAAKAKARALARARRATALAKLTRAHVPTLSNARKVDLGKAKLERTRQQDDRDENDGRKGLGQD